MNLSAQSFQQNKERALLRFRSRYSGIFAVWAGKTTDGRYRWVWLFIADVVSII